MQTDFLLKHLNASLQELKTQINAFEQQVTPNAEQAEALYSAFNSSHKLISAYAILKENKEVANIDMHLKIMAMPTPAEKSMIVEPPVVTQPIEVISMMSESKPTNLVESPIIETKKTETVTSQPISKELPRFSVNINDKFRFINELFASNANEYNTAIEQLNEVNTLHEADTYLKGLKDIYNWDDENEAVKKIHALTQKRFL